MKTLVVGLGNPVFHDDGVGVRISRILAGQISDPDIEIIESTTSGLNFLELITGYDKAIIIDAIQSDSGKPGRVYRLSPEMVQASPGMNSLHKLDIFGAIALGKRLGLPLPGEIVIFGIEAGELNIPDGQLTPEVERAIPICLEYIYREMNLSQKELYGEQTHSRCR